MSEMRGQGKALIWFFATSVRSPRIAPCTLAWLLLSMQSGYLASQL
jgi:hypothetical protein